MTAAVEREIALAALADSLCSTCGLPFAACEPLRCLTIALRWTLGWESWGGPSGSGATARDGLFLLGDLLVDHELDWPIRYRGCGAGQR